VGHLVAGAAIGWVAESLPPLRARIGDGGGPRRAVTPLVAACALLAVAPDFDILFGSHRMYTHSLAAAGLAALAGAVVARARRAPALATGLACGLAVGSHIVLDWLGRDSSTPAGLMALWPLSAAYWYAGIDLFAEISRRYWKPGEFILKNAVSIARELAILVPVAAAAYWIRRRTLEITGGVGGSASVGCLGRSATPESRVLTPGSRTQYL
jgi:hypothetical protein